MNHFAVRRAGVLLAKAAFLLFGLAAIWMMLSLVEPDGIYPWWLVTLASVGSMSVGCCFLLGALICEDELDEDERRAQKVPCGRSRGGIEMKVILIEPGKEPVMMEVNPDDRVSELIGGEPVIQALPNLRMGLFTNGEADRQGLADTGALNLGAVSIRVKGKAIVLRLPVEDEVNAENEYGLTFPDVKPCDLALIRACWVPAVERLEERARRECD